MSSQLLLKISQSIVGFIMAHEQLQYCMVAALTRVSADAWFTSYCEFM